MPSPIRGVKTSILILIRMVVAVRAVIPIFPIINIKKVHPNISKKSWTPLANPYFKSLFINSKSRSNIFVLKSIALFFLSIKNVYINSIIKDEISVAMPAPFMPIDGNPNFPNINI
jgi:hypothetical protein